MVCSIDSGILATVKRHLDEINARPAGIRANALKDRFQFKTEMDEEARRFMFPHTVAAT